MADAFDFEGHGRGFLPKTKSISDYSVMINAISDKLEHIAFLCVDAMIADDTRIKAFIKQLQSRTVTL